MTPPVWCPSSATWPRRCSPASTPNGDGRTGWQEGEGGLEVAQTHGNLMKQAEGL